MKNRLIFTALFYDFGVPQIEILAVGDLHAFTGHIRKFGQNIVSIRTAGFENSGISGGFSLGLQLIFP